MKEQETGNETGRLPFSMVFIAVFYGFMAFMSVLGASEVYILFSVALPPVLSKLVIAAETSVLLYLSIGTYKKQEFARSLLIGYNIFAIADILITLAFVDKDALVKILKSSDALVDYANINLIFCLILFLILRYVWSHKQYFTNKSLSLC